MTDLAAVPKWRKGKVNDLASGSAQFLVELVGEARNAIPNCVNCAYFNEAAAWCTKYGGNPPPRVIVNACIGYQDQDEIPF